MAIKYFNNRISIIKINNTTINLYCDVHRDYDFELDDNVSMWPLKKIELDIR